MLFTKVNKQFFRKGMTTIEYSILIAAILASLLAVQVMLRRALCGKWKASADSFSSGRQYEPGVTIIS